MAESVYSVIELVGTSEESWEKAASAAVAMAAHSLRDLRIAEVVDLDLQIEDGHVKAGQAQDVVEVRRRGLSSCTPGIPGDGPRLPHSVPIGTAPDSERSGIGVVLLGDKAL